MTTGSARIASLPMYDMPELRRATDALWTAIAAALERRDVPGVPRALDRDRALGSEWTEPNLLLAQTCGYVLTHALRNRVRLVATPSYRAPGCEGARYRSLVVVRAASRFRRLEQLRGSVAAVNSDDSHSGMNALRHTFAPLARDGRFFARVEHTGAHRSSLERLVSEQVDVAAVDCVTFALLASVAPELTRAVRVIAETPAAPGLPFITRADASDAELRVLHAALEDAWLAVDPDVKSMLWLDRIHVVPLSEYAEIDAMEADAVRLGFHRVA
jgi:ABC-type phosphate/phosphonate transport system substrate-binding protein